MPADDWRHHRHLGNAYLSMLQLLLSHRVFTRSRGAQRVGKTPRQLLTAQAHAHSLDLLGFQRLGPARSPSRRDFLRLPSFYIHRPPTSALSARSPLLPRVGRK
jgi:hypothetical protein